MRIFWALVAMLVVGAGAMVAVDSAPSEPVADTSDQRTDDTDAPDADEVAMGSDEGARGRNAQNEPSQEPAPSTIASQSPTEMRGEDRDTVSQAPAADEPVSEPDAEPSVGPGLDSIAGDGVAASGEIAAGADPSEATDGARERVAQDTDGVETTAAADEAEPAGEPSEQASLSADSDASAGTPSASPSDQGTAIAAGPSRAGEDDAGASGSVVSSSPNRGTEADPAERASPSDTMSIEDASVAVVGSEEEQGDEGGAEAVSSVERRGDGSYLVDGKHAITGQGTRENPYRVGWDLLLGAEQTYNPRSGKEELPEWTGILDGSWVRLDGYMLLPVMSQDVTELLLMRNQWDGCCIGVPPTAYDAVEVQLAERDKLSRLSVNHGTILGRFEVDPYLSGKWLIGLYMMKDARLESAMGVGAMGQ